MGDPEQPSPSESVKNIVLVGRNGNGKSATGNSLIGKEVFISETVECQICQAKTRDGLLINVIDTPGLFDLSVSADHMNKEISNCLTLAKEGLHAVVLVLSVGTQISLEEESSLSKLQLLFGSKIVDYLVVLFTGGDVLDMENKTLDQYLSSGCPEFLKTVLRLCGGRRVLFNNRTTDEVRKVDQVKQLLTHVAAIEKSNRGKTFGLEIKKQSEIPMEQQKDVESKNHAETVVEDLQKQLGLSYDQNLNLMTLMFEKTLKESSASQEKMMLEMRENFENAQQENDSPDNAKYKKCTIM